MPFNIHEMLSVGSLSAFSDPFSEFAAIGRSQPVRETRETGAPDLTTTPYRSIAPFSPSQGLPDKGQSGQNPLQPGTLRPRGYFIDLSV